MVFKFLTYEQVYGIYKSKVIEKRGVNAKKTDFSYVLNHKSFFGDDANYWLMTVKDNSALYVNSYGGGSEWDYNGTRRDIASRPVLSYLDSEIPVNVGGIKKRAEDGILEVEYGYYPQTAVSKTVQEKLQTLLETNKLKKTGNEYTININTDENSRKKYCSIVECEYEGRYFVGVKLAYNSNSLKLSNGVKYRMYDPIWFEVEPVKWLVDEQKKIMISDKVLFTGIAYGQELLPPNIWPLTNINKYLKKYFSKELVQPHKNLEEQDDLLIDTDKDNDNDDEIEIDKIPTNLPQTSENIEKIVELLNYINSIDDELYRMYDTSKLKLEDKYREDLNYLDEKYQRKRKKLNIMKEEIINLMYKTEDISSKEANALKRKVSKI